MALGIRSRKTRDRDTITEVNKVVLLPLEEITGNPSQPRQYFDDTAIRELAESIRENGLLQPITVRKVADNHYELIAGERRSLAFRLLSRTHIPAIIAEYSDDQSAMLALIENLQRENLNYFEQAMGIARLLRELSLTQQQISLKLGMAQSTIANKLRLLAFSPKVQQALLSHALTERHARALLGVQEEREQLEVISYICEHNLTVEQTERYIASLPLQNAAKPSRRFIVKDMRIFLNSINKAVATMQSAGIPADTEKKETEHFLEYTIRIPKSGVYVQPK